MFRHLHAVARQQRPRPAKVVQLEARRELRLETARPHVTPPPQPPRRPAA